MKTADLIIKKIVDIENISDLTQQSKMITTYINAGEAFNEKRNAHQIDFEEDDDSDR